MSILCHDAFVSILPNNFWENTGMKILIKIGALSMVAELNDSATAKKITAVTVYIQHLG